VLHVGFHNPLSIPLTGCFIKFSGAYIENRRLDLDPIAPDTSLQTKPVLINLIAGWPAKGWVTAAVRIITNQIAHSDVLGVIYGPTSLHMNQKLIEY